MNKLSMNQNSKKQNKDNNMNFIIIKNLISMRMSQKNIKRLGVLFRKNNNKVSQIYKWISF